MANVMSKELRKRFSANVKVALNLVSKVKKGVMQARVQPRHSRNLEAVEKALKNLHLDLSGNLKSFNKKQQEAAAIPKELAPIEKLKREIHLAEIKAEDISIDLVLHEKIAEDNFAFSEELAEKLAEAKNTLAKITEKNEKEIAELEEVERIAAENEAALAERIRIKKEQEAADKKEAEDARLRAEAKAEAEAEIKAEAEAKATEENAAAEKAKADAEAEIKAKAKDDARKEIEEEIKDDPETVEP